MAAMFLAILIAPLPLMLAVTARGLLFARDRAPIDRLSPVALGLPRAHHV